MGNCAATSRPATRSLAPAEVSGWDAIGGTLFAPWREGDLMVMALGAYVLADLLMSLLLPPVPSVLHYEGLIKRG